MKCSVLGELGIPVTVISPKKLDTKYIDGSLNVLFVEHFIKEEKIINTCLVYNCYLNTREPLSNIYHKCADVLL